MSNAIAYNPLIYVIIRTVNKNFIIDSQLVYIVLFCIIVVIIGICNFKTTYAATSSFTFRIGRIIYTAYLVHVKRWKNTVK